MDATADDWLTGGDDGDVSDSGFSDAKNDLMESASEWGNRMQARVAEKRENSKNLARFAEKGASEKGSAAGKKGAGNQKYTSAVNNAKDAEKKDGFANNVQGKTLEEVASHSMPGGRMIVNQAKKLGPLGTILIVVMAVVGIFAGSQTLAPFGLIANGLDQFNNLRTSMNRRETYFRRFRLDRTRNKPITKKATIFNPERFKVSKSLDKKLRRNGIYYIDSDDFDCRFLVYEDTKTGKKYAVAANDDDVGKLPSGADVEIDGEKVHVDFDERLKIDDALTTSDAFAKDLDKGTRTLKGHIAGWFDDLSEKFHLRIGSSRNKFRDTSDVADDDEIIDHAKNKDVGLDEDVKSSSSETDDLIPDDDPDSDEDWKRQHVGTDGDSIGKNASQSDITEALRKRTKAVVGGMKAGTDVACTIMKAYSMLSAMMAAIRVANILNYLTGFLEAIQKTQTGDAGKNELAYYMNGLSEKGITTDGDGNPIREGTSSLMSPAWNQFFSSGELVLHSDDKIAEKFNKDLVMQNGIDSSTGIIGSILSQTTAVTSNIAGGLAAYKACLTAQMLAGSVELVVDFVLAFITVGIGNFIKQAFSELWKDAILNTVTAAIIAGFMALIPHIAQWMAKDLIANMAGEDAAYAINSGFNIYLGTQMQVSSGLPATEEKLMAHWREQYDVIAEEGAYERSQRSPFDPTSKYTFIGSIVNSLMPIANTMSSPLTTIAKTMNTVGSYAADILPTAKADGEVKFQTSLRKDCPNLSQIGLVGDVFCNPYFVTDFSTMAADPSNVIDYISTDEDKEGINGLNNNFVWDDEKGEVDSDGDGEKDAYNPPIKAGSELSKWVVSCAARDSQFGAVDNNVMNAIASLYNTGNGTLDTVIETGVGMLPFIGDAQDIASAAKETANLEWASGENCIKEEYKYYSRYSEDQRVMESMGVIPQSQVAAFLDEYYEKNPIDNSYEGTIARYSGLTKEQVEENLALIEYAEWLAEYNPENYGPEKFAPKPDGSYQYESNEIVASAEKAVVGNYIIFDDLRTRTKIA